MDIDYITLIILFLLAATAVLAMLCIAHKRIRETLFDLFVVSIVFLSGLLISLKSAFKPKREERPPS
ncbi:MAG: hypothetical protein ACYC44_04515 [Patescibacteria group bacterium]